MMWVGRVLMTVVMLGAAVTHGRAADDETLRVKALYDAAAYDQALGAIDALVAARPTGSPLPNEILEVRALSLLALARQDEAEQAIESLLQHNPQYTVNATAPPRWRAAVERVRARTWTAALRARYSAAKEQFDAEAYGAAADGFDTVLCLLAERPATESSMPDLSDFALMVKGFLDLSRTRIRRTPAPLPPLPSITFELQPSLLPKRETTIATRPYRKGDRGVAPPVPIRQELPAWPHGAVPPRRRGELNIVVDEQGRVERSALRERLDPLYDGLLLDAARRWKFKPATKDGTPVKYELSLNLEFAPQ